MTNQYTPAHASSEDDDFLLPILQVLDEMPIHTEDHPFCNDLSCPCHEDQEAIAALNSFYQEGLVSAADVDRIYQGKTL